VKRETGEKSATCTDWGPTSLGPSRSSRLFRAAILLSCSLLCHTRGPLKFSHTNPHSTLSNLFPLGPGAIMVS